MTEKTDFISVGEMAVGFSENLTPQNVDFAGQELHLHYEGGEIVRYEILDADTLKWVLQDEAYFSVLPSNTGLWAMQSNR